MQKIINSIVGALIRAMAGIAGKDPVDWLATVAGSAELDQEGFNKLLELI